MKKILCCDVFKEELKVLGPLTGFDVEFVSMGLHLHPAKLHREVQAVLDRTRGYSLVILGFGLCGGALRGIKAPGCPMVISRVHDCIPLLLGGMSRYNELQSKDNKTFYFSGGWVEGDRMMIPEYERSVIQFGPKKALRIYKMMFENYNRLLYIHTGHPRTEITLAKTRDFADDLQLPCHETRGSLEFLKRLLTGPWDNEEFVIVPAHGVLEEDEFLQEGQLVMVQGT
ncbi:hypothetical protein Tfer_2020 [Thermincola ferriacetica]|uniref:DUF1638 domain-containing protein n=1 Tax=Thermincola ferriacetica TaxID=281456 RepID=A0A0L6W1C8_9FIRM|nr:DUF1638 domain-containing protein [Thermincola ferriacetica]KNZ69382.1 hypothetical protein Tfer_2020 [Thermincola ferriacetica]